MESYYRANSVGDASDVLQNNNNAMVIAGGQQLMLDIRHSKIEPDILIDISEIEELTTNTQTSDEIQIHTVRGYVNRWSQASSGNELA